MPVVVLAQDCDAPVDRVVLALADRAVPVFRADLAAFPQQLAVDAELVDGRWVGTLRTEHRCVDLTDIRSIWYRDPGAFRFPAAMTPVQRSFAFAEARLGLGGVLATLDVLWVNHPNRASDAMYRPLQLVTDAASAAARLDWRAGDLVLLRRVDDRAEGGFEPTWGGFMPLRHLSPPPASPAPPRDRSGARRRTTSLDLPRPWENLVFWFFTQLLLPPEVSFGQTSDEAGHPADGYLVTADGSWCEIAQHPDEHGNRRVLEAGPQRLWTTIEDAHRWWTNLNQPGWERFGLTVTRQRQRVWLDHPDSEHSWELP